MPSHFLRQCPLPSFSDEIFPRSFVIFPRRVRPGWLASGSSTASQTNQNVIHQEGGGSEGRFFGEGTRDFVNDLEKLNF